jgi:hypothetical protein
MDEQNESAFQRVRRIMEQPIRPPEPLTDTEVEALMWQSPLQPEIQNDIFQLPANEEFPQDDNNENQNQLHLQLL